MTNVNITEDTYTVTVTEGVTQVVTVKAPGPQGTFIDGDLGDVTVSSNGANIVVNAGAIDNANIASNAAIDLTKLATGALPTAITVTSANISDLSIVNADINASAAIQGTKINPNFGSQNIDTGGILTITADHPRIRLVDNNADDDFQISNFSGNFRISDITNNADRFGINSNGKVNIYNNLEVGAGVDIAGNLTVSGNMTVSGTTTTIDTTTLTVEDKNIELGKVSTPTDTTADGGGITLKGATDKTFQWLDATDSWTSSEHISLPDSKLLKLGDSQDFTLEHNGTINKILSAGNRLIISGSSTDNVDIMHTQTEFMAKFIPNAAVELYYDASKKLETTTNGIDVTGSSTFAQQKLKTSDGTNRGGLYADNNNNLYLLDGQDHQFIHMIQDGQVIIKHDNSNILRTYSTGVQIFGALFADSVDLNDNQKILLGTSDDLEIYHDGSNSFIKDTGTGSLTINTNNFLIKNAANNEEGLRFAENGAVKLYFDNSAKFKTTSTGITSISTDAGAAQFGTDGTATSFAVTGQPELMVGGGATKDNAIGIESNTTAGDDYDSNLVLARSRGSYVNKGIVQNGDFLGRVGFYGYDGAEYERAAEIAAIVDGTPGTNDMPTRLEFKTTQDGANVPTTRLKITNDGNIQIPANNVNLQIGANQELSIGRNNNHSIILDSLSSSILAIGSSTINLVNGANTEVQARFTENAQVELFYDNVKKFQTTSTGITATGSEHKFVNNSTGDLKLILEADTANTAGDENNNPYILFRQDGGGFGDFSAIGHNPHGITTENNALVLANSTTTNGGIIFKTGSTNGHANATEKFRVNTTGVLATGTEHKFTSDTSGDCTVIIEADTDNNNEADNPRLVFKQDGGIEAGSVGMNFPNSTDTISNEFYVAAGNTQHGMGFYTTTSAGFSNGTKKLEITPAGNILIPNDSGKLQLGTSQDLEIYHNGTNSHIDHSGAGDLFIRTYGGGQDLYLRGADDVFIQPQTNEDGIKVIGNGAVELYFDNSKKLETNSTGIRVNGILTTASNVGIGTTSPNVNNGYVTLTLNSSTNGGVLAFSQNDSRKGLIYTESTSGDLKIQTESGRDMHFATGGSTDRLTITSSGTVQISGHATVHGLNLGRGANSVAGNTAFGENALDAAVTGADNTAIGRNTLTENTSGTQNTAVGSGAIQANTTGTQNVAVGQQALYSNTTGIHNIAIGRQALYTSTTANNNTAVGKTALYKTTTGDDNTGVGVNALFENTTGKQNVAVGSLALDALLTGEGNNALGYNALGACTSGHNNIAIGHSALDANVSSNNNVAIGLAALGANTAGNNTAVGIHALQYNTTGIGNVALGFQTLDSNTTANNNTAVGYQASRLNTTAANCTAIGFHALYNNTTAANNTAVGSEALLSNQTGTENVAIGRKTLRVNTASNNTAVGSNALLSNTTGTQNVAVGSLALDANTTADGNTAVGHSALSGVSTGQQNTAMGVGALTGTNGNSNVAIGHFSQLLNSVGFNNVTLGNQALYTNSISSNNVAIGHEALRLSTSANQIAIGFQAADANTTGSHNTVVGYTALGANTTGSYNTVLGYEALLLNTTASNNTAVGHQALKANTTGTKNTAIGYQSLLSNTTGSNNVAVGTKALKTNSTGSTNISIGNNSMENHQSGEGNVAIGHDTLKASTTSSDNVAIGRAALANNTADNNTAVGRSALLSNTTGGTNTAIGADALDANTTGSNNVAIGYNSLSSNTTGHTNIAIGHNSLLTNTTAINNIAIGANTLQLSTSGTQNVAVGRYAGNSITTGINNTVIGYNADASSATVNNEITLGDSNISGLRCNVQTISALSDARDKTNVIDLPEGLDFITKLRPVKFEWATRDGNGKDGSFEHGFIAQDLQAAQKENDADYLNMVMDENPDRLEASYGKLVPILVKAIQELTMEVNKLKSNG